MTVKTRRHELYSMRLDVGTYRAECKSCAKGSPVLYSVDSLGAWMGAHAGRKCNGCGHAGSSHYGIGSTGSACGTCDCTRYRG